MEKDSLLFAISFHSLEEKIVQDSFRKFEKLGVGKIIEKQILPSKEEIEEVYIYNSLGQLVEKFKNQNQYNIERLSSGIYTIIIVTNRGKSNRRIIKK